MKIKICVNSLEGGVANFMFNLSRALSDKYSTSFIHTQPYNFVKSSSEKISVNGLENIEKFNYHKRGNYYKSFKRIHALFKDTDVVIANDWFELGALSNFPSTCKVIFILHGDYEYYYNLAKIHNDVITSFICVSKKIQTSLQEILNDRRNDIFYLPPLVPDLESQSTSSTTLDQLKIIFIGRLVESKGFYLLPKIDELLQQKGSICKFYIAGTGYKTLTTYYKDWLDQSNVFYLNEVRNNDLRRMLHNYDIFLLPSYAEGFPVSLIECMKAGLAPIVSNLESGIPEIVQDNSNGFLVEVGDFNTIVERLYALDRNRELLKELKYNAFKTITKTFGYTQILQEYFNLFDNLKIRATGNTAFPRRIYRSRLDSPFFPNFFVYTLRNFLKRQ